MTTRRIAPWPDYAGYVIREGDTIVHPVTGDRGTVVCDESHAHDSGKWRVRYEDGPDGTMALVLQVGDRGMAVVASDPPPQPAVLVPADELTALRADAERIDWIASVAKFRPLRGPYGYTFAHPCYGMDRPMTGDDYRAAIDKARSDK